ncbi:Oidioi.mRNA.OKI2018_I69.chr1.g1940.t1.cds [Oikopleura dioica]|uniref:Oidioi.mRNA.OKI2018_I69.chr1.g1940.t1.cds n=1 Tax=Oikopleura dioica TaxID=34765 RepID=A0ABN7STR2_OIKDI|nr:Oidioi.mRNA.OKI2018_I69.chr1.g1940.t1.cds [Oikopleura dioica]
MRKIPLIFILHGTLATWERGCPDCNKDNVYGRDCSRGRFCTDCLENYVESFDPSKPTTVDVPVDKYAIGSMVRIVKGSEGDIIRERYDCKEDNEDYCKYECFNICNKNANCNTGYGYKDGPGV